jgi:hypothetical protein
MSTTKATASGETVTIVSAMDEHGTMTVTKPATGETIEVVDYADELLRERAKTLSPGATARLELTPTEDGTCSLTRLLPGGPTIGFGAD